jgi:hypothetical protein
MSRDDLFDSKKKKSKDYTCLEQVVTDVITIDSLPGGLGQKSVALPEPIEVFKFKTIDVGDELRIKEVLPTRMISEREAQEILKSGRFIGGILPKKTRKCRECQGPLPDDRHWTCRHCEPIRPEEDVMYEYCGVSGE